MKVISVQFKQFMIATVFAMVAILGLTVSNSFDHDYLMQAQILKANKSKSQNVALVEKKPIQKRLSTASMRVIK